MARARATSPDDLRPPPQPEPIEAPELPAILGPGGLPTGDLLVLPLVLLPETGIRLRALADHRGCTVGELIQRAIDELVAREGT